MREKYLARNTTHRSFQSRIIHEYQKIVKEYNKVLREGEIFFFFFWGGGGGVPVKDL